MNKRDYRKTKRGLLGRKFERMNSRHNGTQWSKQDSNTEYPESRRRDNYSGIDVMTKDEFWDWVRLTEHLFDPLYKVWVDSGYELRLQPTMDRLDRHKGYTPDNLEWVTYGENSRRRHIKINQ